MPRAYTWRPLETPWVTAAAAAALLSVAFPLAAFKWGPLALPGVLLAIALTLATLSRPEIGIATALVLVPLGNWGYLDLGLLNIPAWLVEALWDSFVFAVVALRLRGRFEHFPRMGAALLVYWAITFLGFAIAQSQTNGLPILRANTVGLLLFFATALTIRDRRSALWIVGGITLSAGLVGAVAAYEHWAGYASQQSFITNSGQVVSRVVAGFGSPNELGGFLVILVPFTIAGALAVRRGKSLFLLAGVLAVIGIWSSYSRGAVLGLAVVPLFFIPRRWLGLVLPALLALLLIATPTLVKERFEKLSASGPEVATRIDIWRAAVDIWEQNPIVGVGVGGFPQAYSDAKLPGKQYLPDTIFQPPPHAHNLFLQQLAETGLLGFIALLTVLVLAFRTALTVRHSRTRWVSLLGTASLASLSAFVVHNLFDVTLLEGTGVYLFAILGLTSALLVVAGSEESEREESRPASVEAPTGPPALQF